MAQPTPTSPTAQADSDYLAAQAKCNVLTGAEKTECLAKAKATFDQQKGQSSSGQSGAVSGSASGTASGGMGGTNGSSGTGSTSSGSSGTGTSK
jgi:hypothetical protein